MKNRVLDKSKVIIKHRKYGGGITQKTCGSCCKSPVKPVQILDYNSLPKKPTFPENTLESCNDKISTWTIVGMVGVFILALLFVIGRALLHS